MSRDLRELLIATAEHPDRRIDPEQLIAAGRRRRRARHAWTTAGSLVTLVLAVVLVATQFTTVSPPGIVDRPSREPASPNDRPTTPADRPTTSLGHGLDLEAFPSLGAAGVAIDTGAAVVFVTSDGTVRGHLPGWRLTTGGPDRVTAGPVSLSHPEHGDAWVAPADGSVRAESDDLLWAPLIGPYEIVETVTGTDPSLLALTGPEDPVAQFSANLANRVSDGHRVASWVSCPEEASGGLDGCTWHAYDVDMGAAMDLPQGCEVADAFADLNHLLVCARTWTGGDGEVWLERSGPGGVNLRMEPLDTDGRFANAFLDGERVLATWEWPADDGCTRRQALAGWDAELRPVGAIPAEWTSMVVGTDRGGAFVVDLDASCFGNDSSPGRVHHVDHNGTDRVLYEGPLVHAETWDPWISFADTDPVGPSQSAADAERDGVLPAVAELAFHDRAELGRGGASLRAVTEEGVWVVSRMPLSTMDLSDGCGLGATDDPNAEYRRDVICVVEYGEILLLDHDETTILRAFPLPGVPPQSLVVTDDAVYCARTGDGGLPDSMVCRIDRDTFDWRVRVLPHDGPDADGDVGWVPEHWEVAPDSDGPPFIAQWMAAADDIAVMIAPGDGSEAGLAAIDPATLEVVPAETLGYRVGAGPIEDVADDGSTITVGGTETETYPVADTASATIPGVGEVAWGDFVDRWRDEPDAGGYRWVLRDGAVVHVMQVLG